MSELKADELEHIAYMQTLEIQSLNARIAELELGLNNQTVHSNTLQKILTEKLDRIAELEEEQVILKDQMREAKNILIDKRLHIDSLYEEGYKLQKRIAELEAESERFTVHSDIKRQDDKWIPEVQE